jgi:hypothetical protein
MSKSNGDKITVEEANEKIHRFIQEYYDGGSMPVKSLLCDADILKEYLNSNDNIQVVKFMLGVHDFHMPDGGTEALPTLVIVGFDDQGNYVKMEGDMVLDHCSPCPPRCPITGPASNDYIS